MKTQRLIQSLLAAGVLALASFAHADPQAKETGSVATEPTPVAKEAEQPKIAPPWEMGHDYKFGELVSFEGIVFKAKTDSRHKRPNASSEVGWEKLNDCDDKSKGAIQCK